MVKFYLTNAKRSHVDLKKTELLDVVENNSERFIRNETGRIYSWITYVTLFVVKRMLL